MINRVWHGWAKPANADGYENLLREKVLPGIRRVKGFEGAQVLRPEPTEAAKIFGTFPLGGHRGSGEWRFSALSR